MISGQKCAKNILSPDIGENVMSAGNQQERPSTDWIVGFVDGEGCFHVAINRQPKMTIGWQVLPEFRVVQHRRDEHMLQKLVAVFECGHVVKNHDERKEFRVRGLQNLKRIVKFFQEHPLQTTKQENFAAFAQVITLMEEEEHLTKEGLEKIAKIAWRMNRQVKPQCLESSETTRLASDIR